MAAEEDGKYRAPALDKGLDILEYLAAAPESRSQAEISKALERSPSEIYRMLDRLVRRNYVRRTSEDRYELTLKLFEIAYQHPPLRRLAKHATAVLLDFAETASQAAHLAVYDRGALVVIAQVDAPGYWSMAIRVGARVNLVDTGSGHVLLAHSTKQQRRRMLGIVSKSPFPAELESHLDKVRVQGHEHMASKQIAGVTNLAVPVFGPQRSILGALSCPYVGRLDREDAPDVEQTLRLLKLAAEQLSGVTYNTD